MAQGANDFKPDLDRQPEEIREEIAETRSALTEKLETLEERVKGTVEAAQHKVEHTVEAIKGSVRDTVQSVKRTFDVRYHVEKRPWTMVGLSVGTGYVLGSIEPKHKPASTGFAPPPTSNGNGVSSLSSLASAHPVQRRKKHAPHHPGLKDRLLHQFEDEIALLEKAAIGGVMGVLRDWLKQSMPRLAPQLERVMDSATSKMGGEPIASREPFSFHR